VVTITDAPSPHSGSPRTSAGAAVGAAAAASKAVAQPGPSYFKLYRWVLNPQLLWEMCELSGAWCSGRALQSCVCRRS
jgi:hypothetical protein